MKLDANAAGVFPIAPTPFHPDGRIDEASIGRLIERYLAAGVNGVTVLGILGEAPKLEPEESLAITQRFIKGFGERPVIVGVSAPGFAAMRSLAQAVMERGAAGVMIAPLPSLRTDEQIVGYFRQAVEAIGADIPFVLQDYPLTLTVQMAPSVIRRIVEENSSCIMLKHEDWPGLEKVSALRTFQKEGSMRELSILTGGLFLDFEMERGADGAMTGYAFPEMLTAVVRLQKKDVATRRMTYSTPSSAASLRTAARCRSRGGQIRADAQRHPRLGCPAPTRLCAFRAGSSRGRLPAPPA